MDNFRRFERENGAVYRRHGVNAFAEMVVGFGVVYGLCESRLDAQGIIPTRLSLARSVHMLNPSIATRESHDNSLVLSFAAIAQHSRLVCGASAQAAAARNICCVDTVGRLVGAAEHSRRRTQRTERASSHKSLVAHDHQCVVLGIDHATRDARNSAHS